ncbi:MAG: hypothetical protein AAFP70_21565, partial [Calditrichota bacterium]
MKRYALLTAVLLLTVGALNAQTVTTFAGPGIIIDDAIIKATDGTIFGSSYNGTFVYRVSTSGEVSEYMGGINAANGLAFDSDSNLVVAANLGNKIFKVMPDSTKIEFVPNIISPSGIIADPLSDTLYVTQYTQNRVVKIAPDGSITPFLVGNGLNGPVGIAYRFHPTPYLP